MAQTDNTNQNVITMHCATDSDFYKVKHFLKRHKQHSANRDDNIYIVRYQKQLIGIVKLVIISKTPPDGEISQYWLRGLYIEEKWRKKGLAGQLLTFADQHLKEQAMIPKQCIEIVAFPYSHLKDFYLQNGYKALEPTKLPIILQERYHKALNQQKNWLCMRKSIKD